MKSNAWHPRGGGVWFADIDAQSVFWQITGCLEPDVRFPRSNGALFGADTMAYTPTNELIETTRRHVLRGECLVAQQQLLVLELNNKGLRDLATLAGSILDTLKTSLTLARSDLANNETAPNRRFLDIVTRHYRRDRP